MNNLEEINAGTGTMTLNYIDTCVSDYFNGHHLPVVQIPVVSTSTYGEVREELLDINSSIDHLEGLDEEDYRNAVSCMFDGIDMDQIVHSSVGIEDLPSDDTYDPSDGVYMFFVIDREEN